MRALARDARVTQPVIKRLEDTGNAANLECRTLSRILNCLALGIAEVVVDTVGRAEALEVVRIDSEFDRASQAVHLEPATSASPSRVSGLRPLVAPSRSDLRLLWLAVRGQVTARRAALARNGNVCLHRLIASGLVEILGDGRVQTGSTATVALQNHESLGACKTDASDECVESKQLFQA
jgi:hypothetical protein